MAAGASATAACPTAVRVTCLQITCSEDESSAQRRDRVLQMLASLTDVDLVVLPELWAVGYFGFERYRSEAESIDGPIVTAIAAAARRLDCHIVAGSIIEAGPDGALYNTSVLIGPTGDIIGTYRKVHLFGYESAEATLLSAGCDAPVFETAIGRIGITTCYDLRFPELFRVLSQKGAEIVVVPSAWPLARLDHWQILTRARAIENQVYLVACNTVGEQSAQVLGGHSVVIDPWGECLVEAGEAEDIISASLDLEKLAEIRETFPVLRHTRTDVVAVIETGVADDSAGE